MSIILWTTIPVFALAESQPRPRTEPEYITLQIRGTPESMQAAIDRITVLSDAGVGVYSAWLNALYEKGKYAEIEAFSVKGILNIPDNSDEVGKTQMHCVRALIQEKKAEAALVAAKAYYNVCSLKDTEGAIKLISQCLDLLHPDDRALLKRFKTQQVEWSDANSTPSRDAAENVVLSIKIPSEPFGPAADAVTARDFLSLIGKGNLLLMADRASEAKKVFESAEREADKPQQIKTAIEAIARAARAEAGALGPANAYIVDQQKGK